MSKSRSSTSFQHKSIATRALSLSLDSGVSVLSRTAPRIRRATRAPIGSSTKQIRTFFATPIVGFLGCCSSPTSSLSASPQYLHLIASPLIISAQNGHFFSSASIRLSTTRMAQDSKQPAAKPTTRPGSGVRRTGHSRCLIRRLSKPENLVRDDRMIAGSRVHRLD